MHSLQDTIQVNKASRSGPDPLCHPENFDSTLRGTRAITRRISMATTTKSGLSLKHKIGYAMGDLGGCMTFALMGAMVTRYYTNVLQVNTAVLAVLLLV